MATVKKTTAKKKPVAKKAPAKKVVASKTTTRRATTTKRVASKKPQKMKSFRIAKDDTSFTTFKITRQTVYWTILICFIIFVQLWILKLQIEVSTYLENQLMSLEAGL